MRTRRSEWSQQDPEDVAWVVEWQFANALPWAPLCNLVADPHPQAAGEVWGITAQIGDRAIRILLPLRDLGKVIDWAHSVRFARQLVRPPATVRGSLLGIRERLRHTLSQVNPLERMGYVPLAPIP